MDSEPHRTDPRSELFSTRTEIRIKTRTETEQRPGQRPGQRSGQRPGQRLVQRLGRKRSKDQDRDQDRYHDRDQDRDQGRDQDRDGAKTRTETQRIHNHNSNTLFCRNFCSSVKLRKLLLKSLTCNMWVHLHQVTGWMHQLTGTCKPAAIIH